MKILIEVKDNKAPFVLVLLKSLSFIKVTPMPEEKVHLIEEIKEAVENLQKVREGKLAAKPARMLLEEL